MTVFHKMTLELNSSYWHLVNVYKIRDFQEIYIISPIKKNLILIKIFLTINFLIIEGAWISL